MPSLQCFVTQRHKFAEGNMTQRKSSPHHSQQAELSAFKRKAFLAFTLAFPIVALALLEIGLRIFHYGPDLSLFTTQELHGKTYHIMNPGVRFRYFSAVKFNPSTSPDYFLVPKPQGTYRIFCLGGSTTVGFPHWYNSAFSSFLRDRLRTTFPERSIEVINIGMTATNSYTVVDMAREVFAYEPDLLLVYDGHNEFYGALGAASRESLGGSRWLSGLSLVLANIKTYRLARDIVDAFAGLFASEDPASRGTMMERLSRGKTVPLGGPLYHDALDAFTANLKELKELCARNGVPVVLGTQASNLRGLVPFASGIPTDLQPRALTAFNTHFNTGIEHHLNGNFAAALAEFRAAASALPTHAEAHYRIAQCLDTLGKVQEALPEYVAARDMDELRFRTCSDFNAAIRSMEDGKACHCADIESTFAAASPGQLIGNNLVLEHLHPSAYGQFLMARSYATVMHRFGLLADADQWKAADTISDASLWTNRHMTPVDERIAARRTEALVSDWPFQPQETRLNAIPLSDTLGQIADQLAHGTIHWKQAHDLAITYYASRKDFASLEREYRTLINQLPMVEVSPYHRLAYLLLQQQRIGEVRSLLQQSLQLEPTILAYRALGDIALNERRAAEAVPYYLKTFTFLQSPAEQAENGTLLATAYLESGDTVSAGQRISAVLKARPDYMPAVNLLGRVNAHRKQ
jgi:tetratricopeptide (TPR) repeat protein